MSRNDMSLETAQQLVFDLSLFDQFTWSDPKVTEAVKDARSVKKYINTIPKNRMWRAWETWALAMKDDSLTALDFLETSGWVDVWPQLSNITMEDDFINETKEIIQLVDLGGRTDDKTIIYMFTALLWNVGYAYLRSTGISKVAVDSYDRSHVALMAENEAKDFLSAIGMPEDIRNTVCSMVKYSHWDMKYDEVYIREMTKKLSKYDAIMLITMIRRSKRSFIVGTLAETRRFIGKCYDEADLLPDPIHRNVLRSLSFTETEIDIVINEIKEKQRNGELKDFNSVFDYVMDRQHDMIEEVIDV